LRDTEIVKEGG